MARESGVIERDGPGSGHHTRSGWRLSCGTFMCQVPTWPLVDVIMYGGGVRGCHWPAALYAKRAADRQMRSRHTR